MKPSRRQVLKALGVVGLSQALFPSWMPRMVFAPPSVQAQDSSNEHDILVVIFQRGGMDGLNTIVPFGEGAAYYDKRPTIAIAAPDGRDTSAIDLNGFFGLHPSLRPLKDIYDANGLSIVHGAGSPDPTRSHFDAMEYMERGIPGDKMTGTGWINRHLQSAAWENGSPFRAIGMGTLLPASLRGPISALAMKSITDFHLGGRSEQLSGIQNTLSRLYTLPTTGDMLETQASSVFSVIDMLKQFSAIEYVADHGATYPETEFGMGLRQIAQLIKAEVGLEVGCVDIGGWDTHDNQGGAQGAMSDLLSDFAQGLAAFNADMGEVWMKHITVVSMSEFGRTAVENASAGTDHGRASCMFVMGAGATGGVHARWQGLHTAALDEGDLAVTTDYRDVIAEILLKRVQNTSLETIFPGYTPNLTDIIASR